jgi:ubiquinone/menaquinone biosynthesis C-methylase UbiE
MHRMHNKPTTKGGLETTGITIHWAPQYDIFTSLIGLGENSRNSRMVVEMANIKPGDKVLDVGCGSGNLTLTTGRTASAYGIDASLEMIEEARKKAKRSGSTTVFDIGLVEKIAFPYATFDVVISRLVIHHLPDDLKAQGFAEIFRVLKPGGHFFIADFNPPTNPILAHVTSALVGETMMQSDVWSIPAMLIEAGFVDVTSGPTRSAFLAFVSGVKPAA